MSRKSALAVHAEATTKATRSDDLRGMEKLADGFTQRIERDRFVKDDVDGRRLRTADFN